MRMYSECKGRRRGNWLDYWWLLSGKRKDLPKTEWRGRPYPCHKEEVGWRAWVERIQLTCLVQGGQTRHSREQPAGIHIFLGVTRFFCKQKTEGQNAGLRAQSTILQHDFQEEVAELGTWPTQATSLHQSPIPLGAPRHSLESQAVISRQLLWNRGLAVSKPSGMEINARRKEFTCLQRGQAQRWSFLNKATTCWLEVLRLQLFFCLPVWANFTCSSNS